MSRELFQNDAYLRACDAVVIESNPKEKWFSVDQTVFYPLGGGQPGDTGVAFYKNDAEFAIVDTRRARDTGEILHFVDSETELPESGTELHLEINWERRYLHMRVHSCLHLLSATVPGKITGAQVYAGRGRVDFDVRYPQEKHYIAETLNTLIQKEARRISRVCTRAEIEASPSLMNNLSVPLPEGVDVIKLVHFENLDIQPCGGTHIANTMEIGEVKVDKIESKGKRNRRVSISLVDTAVEPNY